jgi:hypothetical protein
MRCTHAHCGRACVGGGVFALRLHEGLCALPWTHLWVSQRRLALHHGRARGGPQLLDHVRGDLHTQRPGQGAPQGRTGPLGGAAQAVAQGGCGAQQHDGEANKAANSRARIPDTLMLRGPAPSATGPLRTGAAAPGGASGRTSSASPPPPRPRPPCRRTGPEPARHTTRLETPCTNTHFQD